MSIQTQTLHSPTVTVPRKIETVSTSKHCVLEYTLPQRRHIASRPVFAGREISSPSYAVPDDPHAMTVCIGLLLTPDGQTQPEVVTEHVPGVLVESDDFVSGYHYGMLSAYEASEDGEDPISEQAVIATFLEVAADTIMLGGEEDISPAFSAGYLFGYARGCTLIGTPAFEQ